LATRRFIKCVQTSAEEVEQYQREDRPLRIRIESQTVFVPWQFLHPFKEKMNSNKFWGFRYELIVDPQESKPDSIYPGFSKDSNGQIIFVKYKSDSTDDESNQVVATLGDFQFDFLTSQTTATVIKVDTWDSFQHAVRDHIADVQMIFAFTHADNGTVLQPVPEGEFTAVHLIAGPKLRFGKNEYISALDLDSLPSTLELPRIVMIQRPLVILNGCETSSGGYFASKTLNFPSIFLQFGARGVIATEAPVWDMFGFYFGKTLITNLKSGKPASIAVLDARKEWLKDAKNPLGLLYSYYGGVDAAIQFPS
jgi:hypothetical protein